jgi:hypothetical protein
MKDRSHSLLLSIHVDPAWLYKADMIGRYENCKQIIFSMEMSHTESHTSPRCNRDKTTQIYENFLNKGK